MAGRGVGVGVASETGSLGRVASRGGDFVRAAELYEAAREQFRGMVAEAELVETDARIAEALVFRNMPDEAIELAGAALRRGAAQEAAQQPLLLRIRGYAHAQQGDWEAAANDLRRSLEIARSRGARYEAALTLDAIAHVAAAQGGDDQAARAEADEIFESLGAVSVPKVPLEQSAVTA